MQTELYLADILQELYDAKKTGALYVRILETSDDLYRMFFNKGNICHIRYGSAVGKDYLDILEYSNLVDTMFFDGISAPGRVASELPDTEQIISIVRGFNKKILGCVNQSATLQWYEKKYNQLSLALECFT